MICKRVIIKQFGPPEVLQVIEEPHLPDPKSGQIRVKVLATSAAYTDTMIRRGAYPVVKDKPPSMWKRMPLTEARQAHE